MRAVNGGVGNAFARWRCKGLKAEPCRPGACA
jgi:hypothetical protein